MPTTFFSFFSWANQPGGEQARGRTSQRAKEPGGETAKGRISHNSLCSYASEDVCSLRVQDPNSQPSFFVVYDMTNARVLRVFDSASDDFLTLYENFCDFLRYPAATSDCETTSCFASSPSTNVHARQAHERFVSYYFMTYFGLLVTGVLRPSIIALQ